MRTIRQNLLLLAVVLSAGPLFARRPVPEFFKRAVVYQISLRNFTRDGNFKAATEMLDHVRSIGVDIVYLTPFVAANLRNGAAEFKAGGVRAKRGASPLLAEGGELSDDGVCRLSPYGFVVVPISL